jgi:hypothetical protein
MKRLFAILILTTLIATTSCKKSAGQGGNSTIKGNVWGQNWNSSFTIMSGEGPAKDQDVYIIYGDETSYGDKISTSPDGSFTFQYLRTGKYKIYSYSKTLATATNPNGIIEVVVDTEITKKKQTVDVGKLQVNI